MTLFISILLYIFSALLFVLMLYQHNKGAHPILSVRNFAIVGMIIYQPLSVGRAMYYEQFGKYPLEDPASTGLIFIMILVAFLILFDFFYKKAWGVSTIIKKIPIPKGEPTIIGMAICAVILTILGFALRFGVNIPLIGNIAEKWGLAYVAFACGIVGWILAPRLLNPLAWAFASVIITANTFNALTDVFGRRPLVALGAAVIWGMFFSYWRWLPTKKIMTRFIFASVIPILFVGLFSAARQAQDFDRTSSEQLYEMANSSVSEGVLELFSGQACGPVSLWLIEAYPERYDYKYFLALRYLVVYPVPRVWWEGKPMPLSTDIAHEASIQGVNDAILTVGPGIVGHIAAEGGWYALLAYAFVGAFVIRVCDQIVWNNSNRAFIILAVGTALGDCMGLSRGETSAFMFQFLMEIFGAYLFVCVASLFFNHKVVSTSVLQQEELDYMESELEELPVTI